jgi:hypothetical protein
MNCLVTILLLAPGCFSPSPETSTDSSSSGTTGGVHGCGGGGTTGGGSTVPTCGLRWGCDEADCAGDKCQCFVGGQITATITDAGVNCDAAWTACGFPPQP